MIKVLDYGSGNIKAILNIYNALNIGCETASCEHELIGASKLILPGVGSFDQAMLLLGNSGMLAPLNRLVMESGIPVLGVCVGMQIMANRSEEGKLDGLGWIDADVVRLNTEKLRNKPLLPHMGWNSITPIQSPEVFKDVDCKKGFYFLHSYCFRCRNPKNVLSLSNYGEDFPSSVRSGNVFGFQFHPEKSHGNGVNIFRNFAAL